MLEEQSRTYKLFISYTNNDNEEYALFLSKLDASNDFQFKDCALHDKTSPENIKTQMRPVDVVVILSGLLSKDETFLNSQIDAARELEKPIVVIRPFGMENVPSDLEEIASDVVGWNTPCIVDAITDSVTSNP